VTLTRSRVPRTRYSRPPCQPSTYRPHATRPCSGPAITIAQNNAPGIIAAAVNAKSFNAAGARPDPPVSPLRGTGQAEHGRGEVR
jgi:hypothetical protein